MALTPGESCVFGYVNLGGLVRHRTGDRAGPPEVDDELLRRVVTVTTRVLDNVLEASLARYPAQRSVDVMGAKRKIGLGVCGFADLLVALRVPYDLPEAAGLLEEVLASISFYSKLASLELAARRGSFPEFPRSRYASGGFLRRKYGALRGLCIGPADWEALDEEIRRRGLLRHASTTALPPSGRSALLLDASTSIEPWFSLLGADGAARPALRALVEEVCQAPGEARATLEAITRAGTCQLPGWVPDAVRRVVKRAAEVAPRDHLAVAAAATRAVDEAGVEDHQPAPERRAGGGGRRLPPRLAHGPQGDLGLPRRLPRGPAGAAGRRHRRRVRAEAIGMDKGAEEGTAAGADRRAVDLVLVGHLAWNEDRTPSGTRTSRGGAAYYCAVGATSGVAPTTGVVAAVGDDFDIGAVERLGVDTAGLTRVPGGTTARFVITQLADGTRTFGASWGVAGSVDVGAFPAAYRRARHVHLATAPPEQQLVWLEHIGGWPRRPTLSADVFEPFVRQFPEATRRVVRAADVVFMNEEEAALLRATEQPWPPGDVVLKRGRPGQRTTTGAPRPPPRSARSARRPLPRGPSRRPGPATSWPGRSWRSGCGG